MGNTMVISKKFFDPHEKQFDPLKNFGGQNFEFFILGRGALKIATRGFSDMPNTMVNQIETLRDIKRTNK